MNKPGYMTSEFWITLIKIVSTTVLSLLVLFGRLNQTQADTLGTQVVAIITAIVAIILNTQAMKSYTISRTEVKVAQAAAACADNCICMCHKANQKSE